MIDAFSPFLALRYLLTRRINLLSIGGVMFAVWAILLVDSVFTGFVSQIRTDVRGSASDLLLTGLPNDTSYEVVRRAIAGDEAVASVAPRLRHHGMLQPRLGHDRYEGRHRSAQVDFDHTENGFALLVGIDPAAEEAVAGLRQWLARGPEQLAPKARDSDIWRSTVLDEPDARRKAEMLLPNDLEWAACRAAGLPCPATPELHRSTMPGVLFGWQRILRLGRLLSPGEPFDLVVASFTGDEGKAVLHTDSLRVAYAGTFATGHRTVDETMVLVPIDTLRAMLGHHPQDPSAIDIVTDVAVRLRLDLTPAAIAAAKVRLQQATQQAIEAATGKRQPACLCVDWQEQNVVFLSAVAHEQGMMQFVLFVVMLVAAFVIYATLHMMVVQKVRDIGILAAVGGSPRSIGAVFLLGGLAVALLGTALGVGLGVFSAIHLNDANDWLFAHFQVELFPRRLFDLHAVPCDLQPSWIAVVAIGAVALALLVAYIPSRKAARLHPVAALSHE